MSIKPRVINETHLNRHSAVYLDAGAHCYVYKVVKYIKLGIKDDISELAEKLTGQPYQTCREL